MKDSKSKTLRAVWLQHNDPEICAAICLHVAFQAMSSFAKRNPFSLFLGTFFVFFALQSLARLECNLEANCKRI